jgi:type IV pilus assembly protein PilC
VRRRTKNTPDPSATVPSKMPASESRVWPVEVAIFSEQLAMMTSQGIPIVQAIGVAAKSSSDVFATQLMAVVAKIETGFKLSSAMALYPRTFDSTYTTLLRAGEECGAMISVLDPLARLLRRSSELRSKMLSSLIYPGMVFSSSMIMVFFLVTYMLPNFLSMFEGRDAEVPWLTRVVMAVATSKLIVIGIPVMIGILAFELARAYRRPKYRKSLQRIVLRIPVLGSTLREVNVIHVARTLGIMREGGVDIYRALSCLLKGDQSDPEMQSALKNVQTQITEGAGLAEAMAMQSIFPLTLVAMVSTGEEAGTLDLTLRRYTDLAEESLERRIETFVALLEPLTMAFVGIVVGVILVAAFLPTYQLMLKV